MTIKVSTAQRKAVIEVLNGSSYKDALERAGYSENVSRSPTIVTKSTGYRKMMALEAIKAGKLTTALIATLEHKIANGEAGELSLKDLTKVTKDVVEIVDKIATQAGITPSKTPQGQGVIDIDINDIIE